MEGEEEEPPEGDQPPEEEEEEEEIAPSHFGVEDVEGVRWEVKCGRRGYERMSTLLGRQISPDGTRQPWGRSQLLQFNDKVWPAGTSDDDRKKLSDKAIKFDVCSGWFEWMFGLCLRVHVTCSFKLCLQAHVNCCVSSI